MLKAGIVGLPNVGKSTLFNALTSTKKAEAANYPFCTIEPNVGIVNVPDERLFVLKELAKTNVVIPTAIEFVDIAGLVKGASKGEGLGNKFLAHIREVNAIIQVVRCFEDENVIHTEGKTDPLADIEVINTELALADMNSVENRKTRILKNVKANNKDAILESTLLDKLSELLDKGVFIDIKEFTKPEQEMIKALQLLMVKPVIYAANVSEEDLGKGGNAMVDKVKDFASTHNADVVVISAKIEEELSELSDDEAKEFLQELGVSSSGIEKMIRSAYDLLDLRTYFTAGEKEVRAWTVRNGALAPEAAAEIHTDIQRGFIKAEVISYEDYKREGSEKACKDKGMVRIEGKEYEVQDGDVMLFRFNV